jgi:hypothetical protein
MRTKIRLSAALFAGMLLLSSAAYATLPMQKQYAANYPDSKPTCVTCHAKSPKLNEYGEALKKALNGARVITPEMFKACEAKRPKS